jgi:3-methyladenine DNA glycosylase AlkD
MRYSEYHDELVRLLSEAGNPRVNEVLRQDRRSQMQYLGTSAPDVRRVARGPLPFRSLPDTEVLQVWDDLWQNSPFGEVLFAAVEYYLPRVRKRPDASLWPVMRTWSERVENWAHADSLGGLYSHILEAYANQVYPDIQAWNVAGSEWLRRLSLVSLIHYSGKNAVFLPPEKVLPLVSNCLDDRRYYVQKAVGWVLREMGHVYPAEVRSYIEANIGALSADAFARAVEGRDAGEREELRRLRKASR